MPDRSSPQPEPLEAMVFDLFHTLVDPEEFSPRGFDRGRFLAEQLEIDPKSFVRFWRASRPERIRSRTPSVQKRIEEYCKGSGIIVSNALLNSAVDDLGRYQAIALERPHQEIFSALRTIRNHGVRLGLLSNCDETEIRGWKSSPLAEYFDFVGFSCDLGHAKPEPEAYEAVLSGLETTLPVRCIFAGDGEGDELIGARKVGFGRIVFMRGFVRGKGVRSPSELAQLARQADLTVDSLDELTPLLT